MLRIGAIFIAVCMVLIAASLGAVLFLVVKLDPRTAAIVAVTALAGMMLYYNISNRLRDRFDFRDLIADLSRSTADLARQMAEVSRRLNAVESQAAASSRGVIDPLGAEVSEFGTLLRQVAETVASHAAALEEQGALPAATAAPAAAVVAPLALS